jgi:hypothetical protein
MNNVSLLVLIALFILKHFVIDFFLETPYQSNNKHILGHLGGILHAQLHSFTSWVILGFTFNFFIPIVVVAVVAEFFIHYFIDLVKTNLCVLYKWQYNTQKGFWYMLGADQALHYLTYIAMIYYIITHIN